MKKIYDIEDSIKTLEEWTKKHPNITFGKKAKDEVFKDDLNLKEEKKELEKIY